MRSFKLLLVGLLTFCLTGCFEMNEEIEVSDNGSGTFSLNMDMGKLVEMMQAFMPAEEMSKADLQNPKDTTIQMKSILDSSSSISQESKALLRDGSMRLQMNMKEKLFKVNMHYPFKNAESLQKLYSSMGEGASGLGEIMKGMNPEAGASMGGQQPDMKQISSYFDLVSSKGNLSRKLNKEKYAGLATDPMMQQMKQMGEMGGGLGEVIMKTTIKLPKAAKKITGSKATLSSDKKSVLLNNNMLDIYEHPEVFEFSVEY